jgi:hypothetical protein
MSVRVSSVFVLSCVGSCFEIELITRPQSPNNCLYDSQVQINSENRPEGLTRKEDKEEDIQRQR